MKINRLLYRSLTIITLCFSKQAEIRESWAALLDTNFEQIHATHHINNLIRQNAIPSSKKEQDLLDRIGIKVLDEKLLVMMPEQMDEIYQTTHFNIHYDTDGSSGSVSSNDVNNNSVPDYVENMGLIFEDVYHFFKDSMGYDITFLNSQNVGNNKYDIFIDNLPTNYFAITYTTSFINQASTSCGSYIKMRNNYNGAAFQNITELENIKITAAHEFFHAIQFSYNCYERFWLMEATAVWSEDEIYNEINDHYRYMPSWFQNSAKPIDDESSHMYGSFIFFQYIDEHLGGYETIKNIWERSRSNANSVNDVSFTSINEALESVGSSFSGALNNMRIANRIMSSHQNADPFTYIEAESYPVTGPLEIAQLYFEDQIIEYSQNYLAVNSANYIKLDLVAPAKISISILDGYVDDLFHAIVFKHKDRDAWTIRSGNNFNIDPSVGIDWATIIINTQSQNQDRWSYKTKIESGISEELIVNNTYPNPFIKNENEFISRFISNIDQNINISIYNILGKQIFKHKIVLLSGEEQEFKWNLKNNRGNKISSGIYFLEIDGQNERKVKKVTILN